MSEKIEMKSKERNGEQIILMQEAKMMMRVFQVLIQIYKHNK